MYKFNHHQLRLWRDMITLIERYKVESITFPQLVNGLEGLLDAGEFNDKKLAEEWYSFWSKLETYNALKGNEVTQKEVADDLQTMYEFLLSKL